MSDQEVLLQGGPRDGQTMRVEGSGLVELEVDGLIHRYIATNQRHGAADVYTYDGAVDPDGATDGAENARQRAASPLADREQANDPQ